MAKRVSGQTLWWLLLVTSVLIFTLGYFLFSSKNEHMQASTDGYEVTGTEPISHNQDKELAVAKTEEVGRESQESQLTWLVRPDHRLTGRLVDHLADLQSRFADGDAAAGFILAVNLSTCDRVPDSKPALDARVDLWLEEGRGQNFIDNLISRYDFCEGVDPQTRGLHLGYFTALADSGYIPAMEVLGSIFDKAYMQISKQSDLPRDEYVKQKRLFQHRKYNYLKQAAKQGSMHALQRLAGLNAHKPDWTQKELDEGYSSVSLVLANSMALLHFTEDSTTYNRASYRQDKLLKMATAEEVSQAEQLAAKLILAIQQSGQAYTAIKENYR